MMNYRNTKTGEIVRTTGKVKGKNWEPIQEPPEAPPEAPPVEHHEDDSASVKPSRKGKK